ncbi:MAG: T9SS type A sorting domain-containing protein [Aquaticitalea sp.]
MIKKYSLVLVAFLCFVLNGFGRTTLILPFSSFGFTDAQIFPSGSIDSNVLFSTQKNTTSSSFPLYYTFGSAIRYYNDSSRDDNLITLKPSNGAIITDVELYNCGSYAPILKYNVDGAVDISVRPISTTYTIESISSSSSLKIRNAASTTQLRLTGIKLNFTIATPKYFRSKTVGPNNWNNAGSWESSDDNITWVNATAAPSDDAKTITIRPGHTITVNSSISLDETVVNGILETLVGAVLNINNGIGIDLDIKNGGVLNVKNPTSEDYSDIVKQPAGSINVATGGKIAVLGNGASVSSNLQNFATNILNVWKNNAVFEWNCSDGTPSLSGETYFPNVNSTTIPVFRIIVQNSSNSLGGGSSTVINGLFDVRTSVSFQGNGNKTFRDGIIGTNATVNIPTIGATIYIIGASPILGGSNLTLASNKNIHITNGITIPTGATVIAKTFSDIIPQFAGKGINNFLVNGSIDMTTTTIANSNPGAVIINGTMKTAHLGGLEGGTISSSSTTKVNTGSTIEYNAATGNQVVTSSSALEGSSPYYNIIFSGGGSKTPANAVSVNTSGSVTITGTPTVNFTFNNLGNVASNSTAFTMNGGRLILGTTGTLPLMDGPYTLTAGVIEYAGSVAKTVRVKNYQNIEISGTNVSNSNGNITLHGSGSFIIKNGGVFEMSDNSIIGPTGTQTLTVEPTGLFKCAIESGFYGAATVFPTPSPAVRNNIETIVFQAGSTVNYNRASPPLSGDGSQTLTKVYSNGLSIPYPNLTISGTGTKNIGTDIGIDVSENLKVLSATLRIDGDLFNSEPSKYMSVNDNVTVADGAILEVKTNGSFIQVADTGTFTLNPGGTATVYKQTAPLNNPIEYTYWSSPIVDETIGTALAESNPSRIFWFDARNYLDMFKESGNSNVYVSGQDDIDDFPGDDWQLAPSTMTMLPGVGYAATLNPIGFIGPNTRYEFNFNGAFNTSTITVPVFRNDFELADVNWNFIGNPYPSAINVDNFFNINRYDAITNPTGTLQGAIYLWSQSSDPSNSNNGNEVYNFTQSDYAVINGASELAGGDNNGDGVINELDRPKRFIPSVQGFFVAFDNDSPSTVVSGDIKTADVIFNNAMRMKDDTSNTQFFRTANMGNASSQVNLNNKLWIDLTSNNGVFNQISVAYVNGATEAYDGFYYDAPRNLSTGANSILYSTIPDEPNLKFAIQGKNPDSLTLDEVVPLGFYTSIIEPTTYRLSLEDLQGEFLKNNTIYIKDNLTNITFNLSSSDYIFSSDQGEFNNRFEIVFRDQALSVIDNKITPNGLSIVELNDGRVKFTVGNSLDIKAVEIFDMLGRMLYNLKGNSPSEVYELSNLSQAAYIAKVTLSNGQVITKRAIKRK